MIEPVTVTADVVDQKSGEWKVAVSCLGFEYEEQPYFPVGTGPIGEGSGEIPPTKTSAALRKRGQGVTAVCVSAAAIIMAAIFMTKCLNTERRRQDI